MKTALCRGRLMQHDPREREPSAPLLVAKTPGDGFKTMEIRKGVVIGWKTGAN
ncbi:hypothetical protein D1872_81690 [compost metagenome]